MALDGVGVAVERGDVGRHDFVEVAQPVEVDVHDDHVGAEARGDAGGVGPDDAAADHEHVGRLHPGDASEQNATAHHGLFETLGTLLNRHLAGHFAHGGEKRETALRVGQGLVGHGRDLPIQTAFREFARSGEVEVAEENLLAAQARDLFGLRLLDFHDHVGAFGQFVRRGDDFGPGLAIDRVVEPTADARFLFYEHGVAVGGEQVRAHGQHGDAIFVFLDLARYADDHGSSPLWRGWV